jgi:hypothetical protein
VFHEGDIGVPGIPSPPVLFRRAGFEELASLGVVDLEDLLVLTNAGYDGMGIGDLAKAWRISRTASASRGRLRSTLRSSAPMVPERGMTSSRVAVVVSVMSCSCVGGVEWRSIYD